MDFTLTDDQRELQAAARHYLDRSYPPARIAELSDGVGVDGHAWPELVRQGWLDPELGPAELALLAEEGGRVLHPVPWLVTVALAVPAYRAAGVPLPGPATLADGAAGVRAVRHPAGWSLTGRVPGVVQAGLATELLVAAGTGDGTALFAVDPAAPGVTRTPRQGVDPLRTRVELELDGAPARLLLDPPAAGPVLVEAGQRWRLLLACEAVGVASRVLELAVDYAKLRTQFDRPIGSYQAVAHQLADSYAELELARSLAYRAACVLADRTVPETQLPEAIACAVSAGVRAAVRGCEVAMQAAGGIGVTWEYPLHRWYRRALFLRAAAGGDPLATIAEQLLGGEARAASDRVEEALASA